MKLHDILTELEVIGQLIGTSKVVQEVNDMLLLAEEVLGKLVAALLELLLGSELDDFLALLGNVFCRSLALAGDRLALNLTLHCRWGGLGSGAFELVNTLHVVEEVVATREPVSRHSTLTVLEVAEVRPSAVPMHTMRLTLVAEQAGSRGELHANASLFVATKWLKVRVDILVVVALQRCRFMGTSRLTLLGAVVLAVLVGDLLVKNMATSYFGSLFLKLSLGRISGGLDIFVAV
jgi:hypothetical protein